jgi:hypothetical protein
VLPPLGLAPPTLPDELLEAALPPLPVLTPLPVVVPLPVTPLPGRAPTSIREPVPLSAPPLARVTPAVLCSTEPQPLPSSAATTVTETPKRIETLFMDGWTPAEKRRLRRELRAKRRNKSHRTARDVGCETTENLRARRSANVHCA